MTDYMPPGLRFAILDRAFKRKMDERARTLGLTSVQFRVLAAISRMEAAGAEEINQIHLETTEQVTHPTMTAIVKQLEKKGFVICTTSPTDRRYKKIVCAEHARSIHVDMLEQDNAVIKELCRGMNDAQIQTLMNLTGIMLQNISDEQTTGE